MILLEYHPFDDSVHRVFDLSHREAESDRFRRKGVASPDDISCCDVTIADVTFSGVRRV